MPTSYSTIYAFGDSLSDAGNVSILTQPVETVPVSPPYYHTDYGTEPFSTAADVFSNGPVWVQDLSITLGLGTLEPSVIGGNDFAYGGAQTGPTPQDTGNPLGFVDPLDLPGQLAQFNAEISSPSSSALYTLSIGGNDVLNILSDSTLTSAQQSTDITDAINNEISFINSLAGDGAKHFLIMNVPDLGKIPEESGNSAAATALSSQYDTQLATALAAEATTDGIDIHILNAFALVDAAVADPTAYGLGNGSTYVTTPVWSGNFTSASSGTLVSTDVATQDQYLFFDQIHPTETGQEALAALALTILPCFAAGTRILTLRGEVPVEDLRVGDRVPAVAGNTVRDIVWIGHRLERHGAPRSATAPVRVRAGTFGPGRPHRDLLLSPDHALYCDGVLVPVHLLVDGINVVRDPDPQWITYFHVQLDQHDAILAEGLPAESYLDTGNRAAFDGADCRKTRNPEHRTWEAKACAPLVVTGPALAEIRARISPPAPACPASSSRNPRHRGVHATGSTARRSPG